MNRLKIRRAVVLPFVAAFIVAALLSGFVPLGQSSARDIAYAAAPAHGSGTIQRKPGVPRAVGDTTKVAASGGGGWTCEWWGGTVQPWSTNYVRTNANGWCDGISVNWQSTLKVTTQGTPHSEYSNILTDEFGQGTLNYGTVPVGSAVPWNWTVRMSAPPTYFWTSTQDPGTCIIEPYDNSLVDCVYSGTVTPFPVAGTSTPTKTPFPTLTPVPANCGVLAYVDGIATLTKKIPVTTSIFTTEFYYLTDTGKANNIHYQKVERTYDWNNSTTGATGHIVTPVQIAVNPPLTGPNDQTVTHFDQIGGVGNGFVNVFFKALVYYTGGASGTCILQFDSEVYNA